MNMRARPLWAVVLLILGLRPAVAEPDVLRFGQIPSTVRGTSSVYHAIAAKKGFFEREGIKLERIPILGGTGKLVAALDAGKVDITRTATLYLVAAALRGSDAVGIASETANPIYSLIVKPEIASFDDLRGRVLGPRPWRSISSPTVA